MQRREFNRLGAALIAALAAVATPAAAQRAEAFLDPAKAGPDFEVQGEYAGRAGGQKLGVQVIALGDGKFQAAFLPGGLPGDGWDGKTRARVDGQSTGELTQFGTEGSGWNARLGGGKLTGQTDQGTKFSLRKVTRHSSTEGKKPPEGATVLFDGHNADLMVSARITPEGLLEQGTQTKKSYKDFSLHVEFLASFMPKARGQGRANSGVFLDGRYEIQILDSFGLDGKNNECGGIYSMRAPDTNMCYPPLSWQTYDIDFKAPEFDAGGQKTKSAIVTVRHNGVVVHDKQEIPRNTGGGAEGPELGAIQLMNHGNPIRFRNVWVIEK